MRSDRDATTPIDHLTGEAGRSPARICRWYGGKRAALSLRFDDSHPTHIENALPLLNEHGYVGTFLVNPGNPGYQQNRAVWEEVGARGGHELGNHTLNHTGARTDHEAEAQIGEAAAAIRRIIPDPCRPLVFHAGGSTRWMQRKPFAFFYAKHNLFDTGNSLSANEETGFTVDLFARRLDTAIANGNEMRIHFHCIGPGHLPVAVESFRRVLNEIDSRRDHVWQAGMSAIHQYEHERDRAVVWTWAHGNDEIALDLAVEVAPEVFRHPLTLELDLPAAVPEAVVRDGAGNVLRSLTVETPEGRVVRFDADPTDATFMVQAQGLGAWHRDAFGADLTGGPHPYLLFGREDLPGLREKTTRPLASNLWQRIKRAADRICDGEPSAWEAAPGASRSGRRIRLLALAYAIEGNCRYRDRAWVEVEAVLNSDQWHMPNEHALRTAEASAALALAYDWMHDALSDGQRRRLREIVIEFGILPTLKDVEQKVWYTVWSRCNWSGVVFGNIGLAALALLDDDPRAADWARICRRQVWHYTQSLGRDGSWGESATYGSYIWSHFLLLADALDRCSSGQTDLYQSPGLPHLSHWFAQMLEPDEGRYLPFSNCGEGRDSGSVLLRLASRYRDPHAQWFAARMVEGGRHAEAFPFLRVDPDLPTSPPTDWPKAKLFPEIDWALVRSAWDDPDAVLFALKGGQMDWDHRHHDANHFVLYGYGRPLIVDLVYPHHIWGCETEAHNTIMVNSQPQAGPVRVAGLRGDPAHHAVVADLIESPWYARLVGDASLAYEPANVSSFVREAIYLRRAAADDPRDYVVLFDDIEAPSPSRMDWLAHTYGSVARTSDGVTITHDQAAVDIIMASPSEVTFEVSEKALEEIRSRSPLEGVTLLRQLRFTPTIAQAREFFVSVLLPRPAAASPDVTVSPVQSDNLRGVEIAGAATRDLALFALDEPEIKAGDVEALGRSCFVRRANGLVTKAALHGGQRLTVGGDLIFENRHSGSAVLAFSPDGVEATCSLFDCNWIRLHVDRAPARVTADGRDAEFTYDPELQWVEVKGHALQHVRIEYGV